jgi:hypothetical protein
VPGACKHAHQGINAEEINPSANEIADPRLRHTEELGGLAREAAGSRRRVVWSGRSHFAWMADPDGNVVGLLQPKAPSADSEIAR